MKKKCVKKVGFLIKIGSVFPTMNEKILKRRRKTISIWRDFACKPNKCKTTSCTNIVVNNGKEIKIANNTEFFIFKSNSFFLIFSLSYKNNVKFHSLQRIYVIFFHITRKCEYFLIYRKPFIKICNSCSLYCMSSFSCN